MNLQSPSYLQKEIAAREALLEAVAFSAKALLSSGDWRHQMNHILEKLGQSTASSRVYVFEHRYDSTNSIRTSLTFEWCAPGISEQISNPALQDMEIHFAGFERWFDLMTKGDPVYGVVASFPEEEQAFLQSQDIKSLVVIPFFVHGAWWGFIGLDQCDLPRIWSEAEIQALQALSSMISTAIERSDAEQKMKVQFDELQKTNHELDFFVYSVSHDLRAPLASLKGLIHVARAENPPKQFAQYLSMMDKSVTRLDGFIKEVLDYSSNSRIDTKIERIDFGSLIEEIFNQIEPFTEDSSTIKKTIEIRTNVEFYSDRQRLEIIFNNLLTNAIRFADPHKTDQQVLITMRSEAKGAYFTVEDNGIGIAPNHIDKIFDMFYRGTDKKPGAGLGLYITKEIVAKLNGSIKVSSQEGMRTQFNLWIPNGHSSKSTAPQVI